MIDYQTTRTRDAERQGLYVAAVSYNDDFRVGDRIIGIDGAAVATCGQVQDIIGTRRAGDVVKVTVMRSAEQVEVDVTLTVSDTETDPGGHVA